MTAVVTIGIAESAIVVAVDRRLVVDFARQRAGANQHTLERSNPMEPSLNMGNQAHPGPLRKSTATPLPHGVKPMFKYNKINDIYDSSPSNLATKAVSIRSSSSTFSSPWPG